MTEKPILFSGPMVRSILDGHKTQTRRVVSPQPTSPVDLADYNKNRPYGKAGDRLWVREPWGIHWMFDGIKPSLIPDEFNDGESPVESVYYRSDKIQFESKLCVTAWRPSIHMPRWACRLILEVKSVRIERLQDISHDNAITEGCPMPSQRYGMHPWPKDQFRELWDSLNEKRGYGWDTNPWVWVIEFEKLEGRTNG